MSKSYNIILNSLNGSRTNSSKTFFFDTNRIPTDKQYKIIFSLTSSGNSDIQKAQSMAIVSVDLGQTSNFTVDANGYTQISKTLGTLTTKYHNNTTNASYLSANPMDNPPIFLEQIAGNNTITVNILTNANIPWVDNLGFPISDWLLILYFESI